LPREGGAGFVLLFLAVFSSRLHAFRLRQEKTAAASHQFEYGEFGAASGSAGNRPCDRGQNPEDAQIIRGVQKRRRFARDQGLWPKTARKDAQVSDSRKAYSTCQTFIVTESISNCLNLLAQLQRR